MVKQVLFRLFVSYVVVQVLHNGIHGPLTMPVGWGIIWYCFISTKLGFTNSIMAEHQVLENFTSMFSDFWADLILAFLVLPLVSLWSSIARAIATKRRNLPVEST